MAQNVYDNKDFFEDYKKMRDDKVNANELIEIPIFKNMLPNLKGKKILDLGCGFGDMCDFYAECGAQSVLGTDISNNMLEVAKAKNRFDNVSYLNLRMEELSSLGDKFDCVFSSLAFHYIEDYDKLVKDIKALLNKGGTLLFSNEHPITTCLVKNCNMDRYVEINGKRYFLVSDYNNNGKRLVNWNVDGVVKYHRNFSTLVNTLIENGFEIEEIQESHATKEATKALEKYKYQQDKPYFIFIKAKAK